MAWASPLNPNDPKCRTEGCKRPHLLHSLLCLSCFDKIEAKQTLKRAKKRTALKAGPVTEARPTEELYAATCGQCSWNRYYRWTPQYALLLHQAGVRCGQCGSALITIDKAVVGRLYQIEDLMSA